MSSVNVDGGHSPYFLTSSLFLLYLHGSLSSVRLIFTICMTAYTIFHTACAKTTDLFSSLLYNRNILNCGSEEAIIQNEQIVYGGNVNGYSEQLYSV